MSAEPINPPAPAPAGTPTAPTEQEINARIEAARKEEKQKLYSELEALKKQVAELNTNSAAAETLKQALQEAQNQLSLLSKAKSASGEVDTLALVRQVADDTRRAVQAEANKEVVALKTRLDEVERSNQQQKLQSIRNEIIAGYKGRIIVAMVVGNTEDEIRASADLAAKEYENIVASNTTQPAPGTPSPSAPPPIQPRAVNGGGNPPATGLDAFKRSGQPAQFGKNRKDVLNSLKERYG